MLENVERINQWFRHVGEIILKGRWGIIIALLVINVFAIGGILHIQFDVSNESWFLEDDPLTIATDEFLPVQITFSKKQ